MVLNLTGKSILFYWFLIVEFLEGNEAGQWSLQ